MASTYVEKDERIRQRESLVEHLLHILIQYVPTLVLDDATRNSLLSDDQFSWVIPSGVTTPSVLLGGVVWSHASLHWMWQPESSSGCLNFLAQKGRLVATEENGNENDDWGTIEAFQWTLEASCQSQDDTTDGAGSQHPATSEFRRFEPLILAGAQNFTSSDVMSPIRSFWKIASLQLLCVELQEVTLMGILEQVDSGSFSDPRWILASDSIFTCNKVGLVPVSTAIAAATATATSEEDVLPVKTKDRIRVAQLMSLLQPHSTPQLQWQFSPVPHLEDQTYNNLADIFRQVYTFLEDSEMERSKGENTGNVRKKINPIVNKTDATTTSSNGANTASDSSSSRRQLIPKQWKVSLGDSLVASAGLAATGASFVSPIGAAVSVAALSAKDGVAAVAQKGAASRQSDSYRFGDVTRGVMASVQERKERRRQQQQEKETEDIARSFVDNDTIGTGTGTGTETTTTPNLFRANSSRYVGVVGSSVGAAAGLALLGGPVGLLAGSVLGGTATQEALRRKQEQGQRGATILHTTSNMATANHATTSQGNRSDDDDDAFIRQLERQNLDHGDSTETTKQQKKSWKFGDNVRSVVQQGKQTDGRDGDSAYQLGDFSKGLLAKMKR